SLLDAVESATAVADALLQLAAAGSVEMARVAEEIALRNRKFSQLCLIAIDRFREELRRQATVARPKKARERRPFGLWCIAIAIDEIGVRADRVEPLAINVPAAVAE